MAGTIEAKFDLTGAIIAFESGELDHDGELELLQNLLDSGMYLHLQGAYGRAVQRALDAGDISVREVTTREALGSEYETVRHFAQSNPSDDALSLAELVSAKLGIELTIQQAGDIYAATV
jgi:hypothetical protein